MFMPDHCIVPVLCRDYTSIRWSVDADLPRCYIACVCWSGIGYDHPVVVVNLPFVVCCLLWCCYFLLAIFGDRYLVRCATCCIIDIDVVAVITLFNVVNAVLWTVAEFWRRPVEHQRLNDCWWQIAAWNLLLFIVTICRACSLRYVTKHANTTFLVPVLFAGHCLPAGDDGSLYLWWWHPQNFGRGHCRDGGSGASRCGDAMLVPSFTSHVVACTESRGDAYLAIMPLLAVTGDTRCIEYDTYLSM